MRIHPMLESTDAPAPLRRAAPGDVDAMTALALRSKRSNGYDDAFMDACRDELAVTVADLRDGEYWVAEGVDLHGFAALRPGEAPGVGEVHAFFIDPGRQRLGTGRRLWRRLLERARASGLRKIRLDADPAAVPFYRALGLVIVGESPSGSIPGRMLPRMGIDVGIDVGRAATPGEE